VNLTLGNPKSVVLEASDVLGELIAALEERTNWAGELSGRRESIVSLRDTPSDDALMVHPLGSLSVRQQVVPLDVDIDLFRSARPTGGRRFEITSFEVNGEAVSRRSAREFFAPAQFFEMSDDEKLARPSFEELPAGTVADSDAFTHGEVVPSDLTYETILIDKGNDRVRRLPRYDLSQIVLEAVAVFGASGEAPGQNGGPGKYRVASLGISVAEQSWSVAGIDDLEAPEGDTSTGTYTEVLAALRRRQSERPAEVRRLQIVGLHERVTP
jgi:hypothetical protein